MELGYIYVIWNECYEKYQVKIGSTKNYQLRYLAYQTYYKNPSKFKKIYLILESPYNCYIIDELLKRYSHRFNIPRYNIKQGGTEHYILKDISYLDEFFKFLKIKFDDITSLINYDKIYENTKLQSKKFDYEEENEHNKQIQFFNVDDIELKIQNYNEGFRFWDHQQSAIDKWNLKSGILAHATGLGKTITAGGMITKYLDKNPQAVILWHTKLKDIIISQIENINNYKKWKILPEDLEVEIYVDKLPEEIKITGKKLIICNSAKLSKILKLVKPNLVITDECHDITADKVYEILENLKKRGVIHLGLSATPIKEIDKSYRRIYELYDNNFIDPITLLDAIIKKIVLPIDINWIQIKMNRDTYKGFNTELTKKNIQHGIEDVEKVISESSTGKIVCWCRYVESSKMWKNKLQEKYKVFESNSTIDKDCGNIQKYIKQKNAIMLCVNRFRQGTNDPSIDTGISLDIVQNRMSHVDLQMIGRICRKLTYKLKEQYGGDIKKRARFIELYEMADENEKIMQLCRNIIVYCQQLHSDFIKYKFITITDNGRKKIAIQTSNEKNSSPITFSIHNEDKQFYKTTVQELNTIRKNMIKKRGLSFKDFSSILKKNNIKSNDEYQNFRKSYEQIDLPFVIWLDYPEFRWGQLNEGYYTFEECITRIRELSEQYEELELIEDHKEKLEFLNSKDKKIPKQTLWKYYSMNQDDFIIFSKD